MVKNYIFSMLLILFLGCKCPNISSPSIIANSVSINEGSLLQLDVSADNDFIVSWQGPDSVFQGKKWLRPKVTPKMKGVYSVKLISKKRKKCSSNFATTEINVIPCPTLEKPIITANNSALYINEELILKVPQVSNEVVQWTGPDSTFTGNPWIRKKVKLENSGKYLVKYIKPDFEIKCESSQESIDINVIDPIITEVELNGAVYFVELIVRDNMGTVNLKTDKYSNSVNDIKSVMNITIEKVDRQIAEKDICRYTSRIDNSETIVGCMTVAATAGCLLGMAATGGTATPACAVVISVNTTYGLPACLMGIADIIAQSITKSSVYSTSIIQMVSGLNEGSFVSATRAAIAFACIDGQGLPPTIANGQAIVNQAALDKAAADKAAADKAAADKAAADKAAADKAARDKADRADKGGPVGDRGTQGGGGSSGGNSGGGKGGNVGGGSNGGNAGNNGGNGGGNGGGKGGNGGNGGNGGGKGGNGGGNGGGKGGGIKGGGLA